MLGDYVPFNFCPRSVMLYAIHCGHQDYCGGQEAIVHLVSRVSNGCATGRAWAFTDRHAELVQALYYDDLQHLSEVPWHVMDRKHWSEVKEERQAEFLVHDFFPWTCIAEIGVLTVTTEQCVRQLLLGAAHQPAVVIRPDWYN